MAETEKQMSEPYRWDRLSTTVRTLLDDIESEGSFYAKGVSESANPGLEIEGLGSIGMPVSPHDAQRLIQHSRQAPFGKGTETFVDTSVRNTWEIDAACVVFCHPKWSGFQQSALDEVCHQLGVPDGSQNVRAELYKLLIYEEGAMFKPHKDTEKERGMFGTLVIALPSRHEGGDVSVSFNGKHETLQTSDNSSWSTSYLAWYSDVLHEVLAVTSGYRIVLTYNLVHVGPSAAPAIANGDPRLVALQKVLKEWSRDVDSDSEELSHDPLPGYLIYFLDHEYTDDSLRSENLKSGDYQRVKGLLSIAEAGECECFLAGIEKREHGGCDGLGPEDYAPGERHTILDIDEKSILLRSIVAIDGTKIVENVKIEEEGVIMMEDENEDPFEGDPDDEDFEGWTGNEGAYTTLWYRRSCLIIMPGGSNFGYFIGAAHDHEESFPDNFCNLLNYYGMLDESSGGRGLAELDYLVGLVGEGPQSVGGHKWLANWPNETWPEHQYTGRELAAAAGACLRAGWPDRFTKIMVARPKSAKSRIQSSDFDEFLPYVDRYEFSRLVQG